MKEGQTLGFDGRVVTVSDGRKYEKIVAGKHGRLVYEEDLAEKIWTDRPAFPVGAVSTLTDEVAGVSVADKLARRPQAG